MGKTGDEKMRRMVEGCIQLFESLSLLFHLIRDVNLNSLAFRQWFVYSNLVVSSGLCF